MLWVCLGMCRGCVGDVGMLRGFGDVSEMLWGFGMSPMSLGMCGDVAGMLWGCFLCLEK